MLYGLLYNGIFCLYCIKKKCMFVYKNISNIFHGLNDLYKRSLSIILNFEILNVLKISDKHTLFYRWISIIIFKYNKKIVPFLMYV